MSERDTSARGKPSEPPYAKYAFANPYNLSLLVGAGSAALLTGHWWVGLCAVAAEAVWMLFAPDSRLLQKKWFDPIWEGEQQEARKARQAAKFNALPDAEKERALRLRDGRLLMTYGYRRPPFGNQARISADAGKTWSAPITVSDDGMGGDLGYPSTVELANGDMLTVWYELLNGSLRAILRQRRWKL